MGSGGGSHGGSSISSQPVWDEMSPEEKEVYLEQQKQAKIRQEEYKKQEHKKKVRNGVLIGIGVAIIVGVIIALICWLYPAIKEGWEEGQKLGETIFK